MEMDDGWERAEEQVGGVAVEQEVSAGEGAGGLSGIEAGVALVERGEESLEFHGAGGFVGGDGEGLAAGEEEAVAFAEEEGFGAGAGEPAGAGEDGVALDALVLGEQDGLVGAEVEAAGDVAARLEQRQYGG